MAEEHPLHAALQAWHEQAQKAGQECVVGAVILNQQGRAFVQKRSATRKLFPDCWDIVGGHVEPGETAYTALAREIREETGWYLATIRAILGQFHWTNGQQMKNELDLLVTVEGNLAAPQIEWNKHSTYRWIGLDEIEILKEKRQSEDMLVYTVVKKGLQMEKR